MADPVDGLFQQMVGNNPGAAVLVVRDGAPVYQKNFGLTSIKDGVAIASNTRFRLASISKQFTAMGIMILAERGWLDYDDPLPCFFPRRRFPEGSGQITVRTLLHHLSGLAEYEDLFVSLPAAQKWQDWPRSAEPPAIPETFEPDSARAFRIVTRQRRLLTPVGVVAVYSNSGYVILGQIIEKVTGQSYATFLDEAIFRPLQMTDSLVSDGKDPVVPLRATSYKEGAGGIYQEIDYSPLNKVFGDDGVYTSINDMRKWVAELDRPTLISRPTLDQAFRRGMLNSGEPTEYGFGWIIEQRNNERLVWHNGQWIGFRSYIGRYPRRKLSIVLLTNCRDTDVETLADGIADLYP